MMPSEIQDLFERIERETNVNTIYINSICAWPLIRSVLFSELQNISEVNSRNLFTHIREHLELGLAYGVQIARTIRRLPFLPRNKMEADVLLFGHSTHYTKVAGETNRSDRIMDPVASLLGDIGHKKYVLGILKPGKYRNDFHGFQRRTPRVKYTLEGIAESGLCKVLHQYGIDEQQLRTLLVRPIQVFLNSYAKTMRIFIDNPHVNTVFLSVWYVPITMGITAAARTKSIRVVDVQHGAEISGHAMYCDWSHLPQDGYLMMPEVFWTWKNNDEETINKSMGKSDKHWGIANCPTWSNFRAIQLGVNHSTGEDQDHILLSPTLKVLFTLQAPCFDTKQRIPVFVTKFLERENPDVIFNIRRHPNDPGDMNELRDLKKRRLQTRYTISDSSEDLIHSLDNSTHHLTRFSSVCIDADKRGIPTLLFGEEALEFYPTEISSGRFSWTVGTENDLLSFLAASRNEISHSPENISDTLVGLRIILDRSNT